MSWVYCANCEERILIHEGQTYWECVRCTAIICDQCYSVAASDWDGHICDDCDELRDDETEEG